MYTPGILKDRVTFIKPGYNVDGDYGRTTSEGVELTRWAAVDWARGSRAMREGALDAYNVLMIRCNWSEDITRECKIRINGTLYHIDSFNASRQAGTIQITATEETA